MGNAVKNMASNVNTLWVWQGGWERYWLRGENANGVLNSCHRIADNVREKGGLFCGFVHRMSDGKEDILLGGKEQ